MRCVEDMGLLLLFGFFSVFYQKPDYGFVLAFLFCISFCCSGCFTEAPAFHIVWGLLLFAASLPLPRICGFFPAVFYIFFRDHNYLPVIPGIALGFYRIYTSQGNRSLLSLWFLVLLLLSYSFQRRTEAVENLEQKLMKQRDDSTEKNLLLAEKNRMLVEKQNYEIYSATLKERNRIAREIHDNVGHLLSRCILITGAAKTISTSDTLSPLLDNLDQSLNQAMTSVRSSVHDLHDDSVNLKETVEGLIRDFRFCPVILDYDMGYEIPGEIKYCFISIIKEALSNTARHSSADQVKITIREHPALYQLCIVDNGKSSKAPGPDSPGIGLSNMKDRLTPLNGTLQITTEQGFRLFITIPKEQEH